MGRVHPGSTAETLDYLIACSEVLQDNAMNCVLSFEGSLDEARLRRAMRLTLDAEPILGCRFVKRWYRPTWERRDDHDLDRLELCRLEPEEPERLAVRRFLTESFDAERDCQVRAVLWRGATDTLGIKLSHKLADGQALKQYAHLLADTYTKLGGDAAYRPPRSPHTDRSLGQLIPKLSEARKQGGGKRLRHQAKPGYWKRPEGDASRASAPDVYIRQLDGERYATVFDYALRRRATVFQVFLAGLFMAARETLPHTEGTTLTIGSVVDLRGYAPDPTRLPLCNLFGVLPVVIEPTRAATLDQVLDQIREQFLATREGHREIVLPIFGLESNPFLRRVWSAIPYRWLETLSRLRLTRRESALLLLTDVGSLSPEHLAFDRLPVTEAFVASGMIHDPLLSLLCVSSYRNTMTICSGVSHAFPPDRLVDRTLAELPREV